MFRLFDICSVFFLTFRPFNFSSSLRVVRLLHLRLFMYTWKGIRQKFQKSKSDKHTFRLFDFSTFPLFFFPFTFRFFGFSVFLLPFTLFEFRTQGWAFTPEKASGKNSKSQKVTSILFDFSTFRLFHCSSSLSPFDFLAFRFFFFPLRCLNFVHKAEHLHLKRHPAKIQKVKTWKVYFSTFRRFFFSQNCLTFVLQAAHV